MWPKLQLQLHELFKKDMYLIHNLKLSLLKRYSITGWILKKSLLSKIIKNWDLHSLDTSLEYFVLVLFLVGFITIYVSTCFSSALDKCILLEFFTPSTVLWDWWKMELEGRGPCDLKGLEERAYGAGQRFSSGWRYSQGPHYNKAGNVLHLEEKQLHKA